MPEIVYLALDPGGTTGWATFNETGDSTGMGSCPTRETVYELLRNKNPSVIVCEDWITRGHTTFGGDKMETARVIGAVEFYAYLKHVKVVLQPNTVKPIAYKWAGLSKPKAKVLTHETDAYVHGVYYLQKAGIRRPQQGRRNGNSTNL